VQRVYAFLDPLHCGPDQRVGCGIAVLDPVAGGLRADVSGRMPYLAPIPVPNLPTGFAISGPPAKAPEAAFADPAGCKDSAVGCVIMKVLYGTEPKGTTAVMAVPTTGGAVYYVDLGRWAIPNNTDILRGGTRTAPTSGAIIGLLPTPTSTAMALGVWSVPRPGTTGELNSLRTDSAGIVAGVTVTPGYTNTDTWTVTFEGVLPGLEARLAETGDTGDGRTRVAVQVTIPCTGGSCATQVARLYDPALGVRVGDIVQVQTAGLEGCGTTAEGIISELLPPDPAHPGGSVAIEPDPTPCGETDSEADVACRLAPACIAGVLRDPGTPLAGQPHRVVSVRSGAKVAGTPNYQVLVTSSTLGYAGRTRIAQTSTASDGLYKLEYPTEGEDALAAGCTLVPWPFPEQVTATTPAVACDATCRSSCEALLLARKARRIYHVSDKCEAVNDVECGATWRGYNFPLADGPVMAFRIGLANLGTLQPDARQPFRHPDGVLTLTVTTRSGISLASRSPSNLGGSPAYPQGVATFDKSPFNAGAGYRFYVPYADGHVLDFTPAASSSSPTVIR
jgi:hypothetical protein